MITRQWILAILWELPLWYWPVFFWEVRALQAWWATGPLEPGTLITFAVTPRGRIMVSGLYPPTLPDPADWTVHAPYAPWEKLAPGAGIEALVAQVCGFGAGALWCTENVPLVHAHCPAPAPFLDSG